MAPVPPPPSAASIPRPRRWALIVGARGTGKSWLSARVVASLTERGVAVAGVFQEAMVEGDERVGYRACRAARGDSVIVARKATAQAPPGDVSCSFAFDAAAFAQVRRWIAEDTRAGGAVLIDEVSKQEVSGGGHYEAIVDALQGPALVILAVRADQLVFVMEKLALDEPVASIETNEQGDLDAFVSAVALAVRAT